jgi:hypothetical protein
VKNEKTNSTSKGYKCSSPKTTSRLVEKKMVRTKRKKMTKKPLKGGRRGYHYGDGEIARLERSLMGKKEELSKKIRFK